MMYLATRVLDNYHDLVFGVAGDMRFYERFIESDLDYDPAVLRTVYAECIFTHYKSVNDSSESRSEVCIMCRAWLLSDE